MACLTDLICLLGCGEGLFARRQKTEKPVLTTPSIGFLLYERSTLDGKVAVLIVVMSFALAWADTHSYFNARDPKAIVAVILLLLASVIGVGVRRKRSSGE